MKRERHCFYNVAGLPSTQNADIDHLKQQRDNWPYSITQTAPWIWIWAASLSLLFVVLLNAWVCHDAYITFRTCFHLTQGHGPVYNLSERVQTYTNPLWKLLFSCIYLFTGEAYFTAIAAEESVRYLRKVKQASEAGAELARRMAQVGNFSKLRQAREQAFYADAAVNLARA